MHFPKNPTLWLVVFLVLALAIRPQSVYQLSESILGRILLLGMVLFMARKSLLFGLLMVLIIVSLVSIYGTGLEGFTDASGNTVTVQKPVLTADQTAKVQQAAQSGVDREDIRAAIASKVSSTIPVDKSTVSSSENTEPSTEGLMGRNTLTENFCSSCAAV